MMMSDENKVELLRSVAEDGKNTLHYAVDRGDIDAIRRLLADDEIKARDLNRMDGSGFAPLHYAAFWYCRNSYYSYLERENYKNAIIELVLAGADSKMQVGNLEFKGRSVLPATFTCSAKFSDATQALYNSMNRRFEQTQKGDFYKNMQQIPGFEPYNQTEWKLLDKIAQPVGPCGILSYPDLNLLKKYSPEPPPAYSPPVPESFSLPGAEEKLAEPPKAKGRGYGGFSYAAEGTVPSVSALGYPQAEEIQKEHQELIDEVAALERLLNRAKRRLSDYEKAHGLQQQASQQPSGQPMGPQG
jgi:hypothetical protein